MGDIMGGGRRVGGGGQGAMAPYFSDWRHDLSTFLTILFPLK